MELCLEEISKNDPVEGDHADFYMMENPFFELNSTEPYKKDNLILCKVEAGDLYQLKMIK